jgi:4-hydroxy-tetrahydrodipicolinate synthase
MAMVSTLEGTFTALVTPFQNDAARSIDWDAFDALIDAQIDADIDGLVPCGTTGESPTLSFKEQREVIARVVSRVRSPVKATNKKPLVIAGTGSNATHGAIDLARAAEDAGADAVMVVVPYYNRPTQEGLHAHFVAVAKSVQCAVVIYNVPARTGIDLAAETLAKIASDAPNVIATKEATGNVLRAQQILSLMGDRMTVISGDDMLTLPMIACGARGVISVTSNLLPAQVRKATRLALDGKFAEARRAHLALLPVHEVMFVEANPSPVKAALAHAGKMKSVVRGPLAVASEAACQRINDVVASYARTEHA